ncbi:response regulator [Microcoleus sp. Pol11C2]|uniref:response regulator n=1 Tax=Microcoleus sp. Pol11C2 TaxID=3055389 RepID=UPI002FD24697
MANETSWRLLFVDDDKEICAQVKEFFEYEEFITDGEASVQVTTLTSFKEALNILENGRFDLIILDVRLESNELQAEEAGISTLEAIKRKRFIPIVFYTGVAHLVRSFETPLIKVVEKTEGLQRLQDVVKEIFTTRLPAVNRALIRHLETVQRDYMWEFVATHWEELSDTNDDHAGLAYLLARRLGVSLSGSGIYQLAEDLGGSINTVIKEGCVHPMQYYVMPPLHLAHPLAGDIYKENIEEQAKYWIILTPSCDFAQKKVQEVLFARCELLSDQKEYKAWQSNLPSSKSNEEKLKAILKNNRQQSQPERFYFLPGTLALPDLLVDFQQLKTLQCEELEKQIQQKIWERVASLDSPFTEALLARFTRYLGRLGTPDLDLDMVMNKLRNRAN